MTSLTHPLTLSHLSHPHTLTCPQAVVKVVDKAVEEFAKSGRIPASVMEMIMFRKPYFIRNFLPHILAPRPATELDEAREGLIRALKRCVHA